MKTLHLKHYVRPVLFLLIISYGLLFYKVLAPKTIECTIMNKEKLYSREQIVQVKHKKKVIQSLVLKEVFTSEVEELIALRKDRYSKDKYMVKENKNKIRASKKVKTKKEYTIILKELSTAGYTCK